MFRLAKELLWLAMNDPDFSDSVNFSWWPCLFFKHRSMAEASWIEIEITLPRLRPIVDGRAHRRYMKATGQIRVLKGGKADLHGIPGFVQSQPRWMKQL